MTKGFRITVGLLLVAVVGVFVWKSRRPGEPMYEGKTLSYWLGGDVLSWSSAGPPNNTRPWWSRKTDEALGHIGTNAIPTLLQMLRAKDLPPAMLKLLDLPRRLSLVSIHYRSARERNHLASLAFTRLGTNAAYAVPALIKMYEDGLSQSSQECAAYVLGTIGPAAKAAIPLLLQNLTNAHYQVRCATVHAIGEIGGDPSVIVPALRRALYDPSRDVHYSAIGSLAAFGGRARPAVPRILAVSEDWMRGHESTRQYVETSLWRIAPEKIGKPLVVEESTPMVTKGVTTEALDALYNGERRTLIRPGTPVPCVGELWNREPRALLKLYRGTSQTTAKDHFLGQFEVMGIPSPPTNVNAQVVCVIADQQIVLCARDHTRKLFLEVRRLENEATR